MDTIIQALFSWQFLFFTIAVAAAVFVIRQVIEYAMENWWPLKKWKSVNPEAKIWRALILPILPTILGPIGSLLATNYPYPDGFSSNSGKIIFGIVAGYSSGLIVRVYKSFLISKSSEFAEKISNVLKPSDIEKANSDVEDKEQEVRNSIKKD